MFFRKWQTVDTQQMKKVISRQTRNPLSELTRKMGATQTGRSQHSAGSIDDKQDICIKSLIKYTSDLQFCLHQHQYITVKGMMELLVNGVKKCFFLIWPLSSTIITGDVEKGLPSYVLKQWCTLKTAYPLTATEHFISWILREKTCLAWNQELRVLSWDRWKTTMQRYFHVFFFHYLSKK